MESATIDKKKILFLVTQSEFGGAQRYIFEMASSLDSQKYEISVAAGEGDGELFLKLRNKKIEGVQLKWLKRNPLSWQSIPAIKEILNILKKENPDILFLCSTTAGFLGSIAGILHRNSHKIQIIYRIGGWAFNDPRHSVFNKAVLLMEKISARWKDKIVVNSEFDLKTALEKKVAPPEKMIRIYNGLNSGSLEFLSNEEARNRLGNFLPGTFLIGTVANFYKTKGLDYLIEAADKVSQKLSNARFLIIGEGKQRQELEKLIKKYNLQEKVILKGRVPEAYKYLKAFDIFVLPSVKEGFPWIILETMAAQIPIIATQVGALPEILKDGVDGILVEPKNSDALAEKITEAFSNQQKFQNFAARAAERLENKFSKEKMVAETEKLFI
ncbi:MAG: glycosyltransferase [Candidatus Parcubacteria bacterium]|nr:glycosyltransferase [Candidatus Parcubacteria bacterium]